MKNSHLTLRFFGDVGQRTVDRIRGVLAGWHPGVLPFRLDRVGRFGPPKEPPRVVWLGGIFPKALDQAAEMLGSIPDDRGNIDKRRFLPHITVARNRGDLFSCPPELESPIAGEFTEVSIYSSVLRPGGPLYSTISRFDLRQEER